MEVFREILPELKEKTDVFINALEELKTTWMFISRPIAVNLVRTLPVTVEICAPRCGPRAVYTVMGYVIGKITPAVMEFKAVKAALMNPKSVKIALLPAILEKTVS